MAARAVAVTAAGMRKKRWWKDRMGERKALAMMIRLVREYIPLEGDIE